VPQSGPVRRQCGREKLGALVLQPESLRADAAVDAAMLVLGVEACHRAAISVTAASCQTCDVLPDCILKVLAGGPAANHRSRPRAALYRSRSAGSAKPEQDGDRAGEEGDPAQDGDQQSAPLLTRC
jgi:hypothetical protein